MPSGPIAPTLQGYGNSMSILRVRHLAAGLSPCWPCRRPVPTPRRSTPTPTSGAVYPQAINAQGMVVGNQIIGPTGSSVVFYSYGPQRRPVRCDPGVYNADA